MKILLVDDSDFSMDMLSAMLPVTDASDVIRAKDGDEAVQIFKNSAEGEISLIIMDIIMEKERGDKAADDIRALDRADAKSVIIFAATAYKAFDIEKEGKSFNGVIFKPFKRDEVNQIIESCKN